LDVDDDVLQAVKEIALRERSTAGRVISALARRELTAPSVKGKSTRATRGGVPLLPSRGEVVTFDHVWDLMDREGV
jgi:hypothetical protein